MRIVESPQDFQLSLDLLEDIELPDFAFVEHLDCHFMTSLLVESH